MTPDDVRFLRNLTSTLRGLSTVRLYWIADTLARELAIRGADCEPEARALVAALLAEAATRQRAIYSTDCSELELAIAKYEHEHGCHCRACRRLAEES